MSFREVIRMRSSCQGCGSEETYRSLRPSISHHQDVYMARVCQKCDYPSQGYQYLVDRIRAYRLSANGVKPDSVFPSRLIDGPVKFTNGITCEHRDGDQWVEASGRAYLIDWKHYYETRFGATAEPVTTSTQQPSKQCGWCKVDCVDDVCSMKCHDCVKIWQRRCLTDGTNPANRTDYDRESVERFWAQSCWPVAEVTCRDAVLPMRPSDTPQSLDQRIAIARYEQDPHGLVWSTPSAES